MFSITVLPVCFAVTFAFVICSNKESSNVKPNVLCALVRHHRESSSDVVLFFKNQDILPVGSLMRQEAQLVGKTGFKLLLW